jgi:hypothetical protein
MSIRDVLETLRSGGGVAAGCCSHLAIRGSTLVVERASDGSLRLSVLTDPADAALFPAYGLYSVDAVSAGSLVQLTAAADNLIRPEFGHRPSANPAADALNTMRQVGAVAAPAMFIPAGVVASTPAPAFVAIPSAVSATQPAAVSVPATLAPAVASLGAAPTVTFTPTVAAAPPAVTAAAGATESYDAIQPIPARAGRRAEPKVTDFDKQGVLNILPYQLEIYLEMIDVSFESIRMIYETADRSEPGSEIFLRAFAGAAKSIAGAWDSRRSVFGAVQAAQQRMREDGNADAFSWRQMACLILNTIMTILRKPVRFQMSR